ncbi:MAG: ABC transporter permease [Gammaproteobacteria bacterium]|nr:ABC transporter permease [Gammaproteobacteria bacterium]
MSDILSNSINAAFYSVLWKGTWETLYMVLVSGFMAVVLGTPLGLWLFATRHKNLSENIIINKILSAIIDVTRSLPFIILLIAIIPFTRWVIGTTIGTTAAIVPLTIAAIPFMARVVENALLDINPGLIEAGMSFGASTTQILLKILLPESLPALINGITLMLISLIGYSAMAGAVGGGGLGTVAINYGYQRFDITIMLATVAILIIIVHLIQYLGNRLSRKLNRQ